jgi:chitinase
MTLWTNHRGDKYGGCSWYRKKALCCTPNDDALEEHLCDFDPCKDDPDLCDDGGREEVGIAAARLARRTYIDPEDRLEYSYLEKRAAARPGMPRKSELATRAGKLIWHPRPYLPNWRQTR